MLVQFIKRHHQKISFFLLVGGFVVWYFFPSKSLPEGIKVDLVEVYKSKRQLKVFSNGNALKKYKIALGPTPKGHKQFQGDGKTPEGEYLIDWRNPESCCHLSLHISYPNKADKDYANKQGKSPGGDIMIHGINNGDGWIGKFHRFGITNGCIRVTNSEMDELWRSIDNGTLIRIYP